MTNKQSSLTMTEAITEVLNRLSELTDEDLQKELDDCKGGAIARAFLSEDGAKRI